MTITPMCFPAFNFSDFEVLDAILAAAGATGAELIVQISQRALEKLGVDPQEIAERVRPLPLHLDHASDFDLICRCLESGFDSVHVKGDINLTKKVLQGPALQKIVEGEVGKTTLDPKDWTDPQEAAEFVKETGVNRLAVAVGNVHGIRKEPDRLDFDLLEKIHQAVNVPLVLHGGSFIRKEDIQRAAELGVEKINFNTELKLAYNEGGKEAVQRVVEEKLEWLK